MQKAFRSRSMLVALPLLTVAGCGASFDDGSSGVTPTAGTATSGTAAAAVPGFAGASTLQGTNDAVVATAAVGSTVAAVTGAGRTVSVIFNSSDGRLISGFGLSGSLGSLPAGWSGPPYFACAAVDVGSSCVLNLTYAPTAVDNGVLTLNYVYVDDATQPKTGDTVSIAYAATTANNVVATASPTGQVATVLASGSGTAAQSVTVAFTTDDGNAATDLTLNAALTTLPPGWTSAAAALSCPIVGTGNGCELLLRYAPTAAASGTLRLGFSYTDDSGGAKTGEVDVPYTTTSPNNVIATASPGGQITAVRNSTGRSVPIAFTTDDGRAATRLFVTSDLAAMPAGWTSAVSEFACAGVSSGNGCQLLLNYAPTTLGGGTFALEYAYTDSAGAARTAVMNIAYAATTDDQVGATASPAGPIAAVIGDGSQPGNGGQTLSVTFASDDGRPATALALTTDLGALPAGWRSTAVTPFVCEGIDTDNVCRLTFTYAPTAPGAGTLALNYTYVNDAGTAGSGTVDIAYRATANDNVQWSASAPLAPVRVGSSNPVVVTFQTDDGNPASSLAAISLTSLPADWSGPAAGFSCATVSAGTPCILPLTYAPTAAIASGTLSLRYTYINDAGYPGSGTVTVTYGAFTP